MTCPECQIAYDPAHWDACPHCGCEHEYGGMEFAEKELFQTELSGVMRTSTILIAAGSGAVELYASIDEVPEPLRRKLVDSTSGLNSATIYIADQGGRERMVQALRNLPASHSDPVQPAFSPTGAPWREQRPRRSVSLSTVWCAVVLATVSGFVIWMAGGRPW